MSKDLTRSVLILSSEPRALIASEQFLINRGWTVTVTGDEKTALNLLIERRPSFMLISVQHKNRKVRSLHTLMKQTFPDLCIILFAEYNSMESYRLLLATGHPYRIQPPITGPGIERAANRFFKDSNDRQTQERLFVRSLRKELDDEKELTWAPAAEEEDSLLSKGMDRAMDGVVNRGDGVVRAHITGKSTNTACIVIESVHFSGYLIAAMAGDRPFEETFISLIRQRLLKFLRENGEVIRDGDSFPMKIREVAFTDWATDYAEFLKRSVHEGHEIAFAFFPLSDVNPQVNSSAVAHMLAVQIGDFVADAVVDFDVYLHLPANQKLLLYTPKGSALLAKQKDRLVRSGVRELHIKNEDLPAFKRYHAQNHISELIRDFEERQKPLAG